MSKNIETLLRNFLWEGVEEDGGSHLVRWEVVSKLMEVGGLGIGNLRLCNEPLLANWLAFLKVTTCFVVWYGLHPVEWVPSSMLKSSSKNL